MRLPEPPVGLAQGTRNQEGKPITTQATHIRDERSRYGRGATAATNRVIIYSAAGILGVVRGLIGYSNPTYWAPTTQLDWASVITFSCFLVATAISLTLLVARQRAFSRWPINAAAAGAAVAAAANAFEDGFGLSLFGYPFAVGIAVMVVGLLLGGAALTVCRRGPRALGLLLLASVAALALAFDNLGLVLFGSTWLVIAGQLVLDAAGPTRSHAELPSGLSGSL
jgi:hypothetical protein